MMQQQNRYIPQMQPMAAAQEQQLHQAQQA